MGRRKKADAVAAAATAEPNIAVATPETNVTEPPPFEPTGKYSPTADELDTVKQNGRGRYRSWTTDAAHGYSKLVDNEKQQLVLLFDQKPGEDVRTAMKGAGFQYHPDYDGHKNAWTRYNDYEGRLQVEALETLIRGTSSGVDSPAR